ALGKAKAMDLCLTGRMMDAAEAERAGLVARVVPAETLEAEALNIAATIAAMPVQAVMLIKESIRQAESVLEEGILFERRLFQSLFATQDQKEGMAAFLEKRKPDFKNR
ncbi:MAG: enoyl-CoA hydratase-related protein, partial [Methylovirgula sp.]